jgi:hypothetical protein
MAPAWRKPKRMRQMATTDGPATALERWPLARFALDANGDGEITAADVTACLEALFFLPGDTLLFALLTWVTPLARGLGFGPADFGGVVSGAFSACAWLASYTLCSIAWHYVRDLDHRATGALRRLVATGVLRIRIAHALLRQRLRAHWAARRPPPAEAAVREVELSTPELRVLQVHAALAPGYALSVGEVTQALRARPYDAEKLLRGLKDLGLLDRTQGGIDDEAAYTLSAAGKALLAARAQRRPAGAVPRA